MPNGVNSAAKLLILFYMKKKMRIFFYLFCFIFDIYQLFCGFSALFGAFRNGGGGGFGGGVLCSCGGIYARNDTQPAPARRSSEAAGLSHVSYLIRKIRRR